METKDILKQLRKSRGYSNAKDFCDASGISYNTYQNYEAGKRIPTADILITLAEFYGVTTDYLLGRSEKQSDLFAAYDLDEEEKRFFIGFLNKNHFVRKLVIQTFKPLFEQFKFTIKDEEGNEKEIQFKNLFEL